MILDIQQNLINEIAKLNNAADAQTLINLEAKPLKFINLNQQPVTLSDNFQKANYIYQNQNIQIKSQQIKTGSCLSNPTIKLPLTLIIIDLCNLNIINFQLYTTPCIS
jgi:hypothetical protein